MRVREEESALASRGYKIWYSVSTRLCQRSLHRLHLPLQLIRFFPLDPRLQVQPLNLLRELLLHPP